MNRPLVDLRVDGGAWPDEALMLAWVERAVDAASAASGLNLALGEVSVVLADDAAMRAINLAHRGQDKATNVLSFPAMKPEALPRLDGKRPFLLGDLVFAQETVEREAAEARISLHDHMGHLIVHGFLHLLGYDHLTDPEADRMEALETRILAGLGISDPYSDAILQGRAQGLMQQG